MANPPRATKLNLLTNDELEGLPTNNLESERHLAGFGKRAAVAKFRNQRFTAKGIRNDLYQIRFNVKLKRVLITLLNC